MLVGIHFSTPKWLEIQTFSLIMPKALEVRFFLSRGPDIRRICILYTRVAIEGFGNPDFFLINLTRKSRLFTYFIGLLSEIRKFSEFENYPSSVHLFFEIVHLVWKNFSILSPKLVLEYAEDILSDSRLKNCAKCKGGWCKSVCVERFEIWVKKGIFWWKSAFSMLYWECRVDFCCSGLVWTSWFEIH